MERLTRVVDAISAGIARVVFWLMLAVVLLGAFNALARYAGRSLGTDLSSNAYLELQWYLFGAIFLLGGAHTLRHNAHVRVDVLYDRLGRRARAWIDLVGHTLFLLPFCAFAVYASVGPVADSWSRWETSPDPGGLPRYPAKTLIPLAFALLGLQGLAELLKQVRLLRSPPAEDGDAPPEAPTESAPPGDDPPRDLEGEEPR